MNHGMTSPMDTTPVTQPTMDRQEFFRLVGISVGTIALSQGLMACTQASPDPATAAKSGVSTPFTINLNDAKNDNLKIKGGYLIINEIIVARTLTDQFVAVGAYCTHQGTQLVFKGSESRFYCALHGSNFDTSGNVLNGPAQKILTMFKAILDSASNVLTISA